MANLLKAIFVKIGRFLVKFGRILQKSTEFLKIRSRTKNRPNLVKIGRFLLKSADFRPKFGRIWVNFQKFRKFTPNSVKIIQNRPNSVKIGRNRPKSAELGRKSADFTRKSAVSSNSAEFGRF